MLKKASIIFNTIIATITLGGTGVCIYLLLAKEQSPTIIKFNGDDTKKEYNVSFSSFYPGQEISYEIQIISAYELESKVSLDFKPLDDTSLASYLDLVVYQNDKEVSKNILTSYFTNPLSLANKTKETTLKLKYFMPVETNNSAKNTKANFTLEVNVTHL